LEYNGQTISAPIEGVQPKRDLFRIMPLPDLTPYFIRIASQVGRLSIIGLAACVLCSAQGVTLGLSSGSGFPGSAVALNLSLTNAGGDPAASVEWTLGYSTVDFSSATVTTGPAAGNKELSCNSSAGTITCELWGMNTTPITSGVVATVSLALSTTTTNSTSSVQLANSYAADASALALSSSTTGATVTILQPGLNGFSCSPIAIAPPLELSHKGRVPPHFQWALGL
jgi:hypothetical protein